MASSNSLSGEHFNPSERVCKFWLAGTCLQGSKCRMLHPRAPATAQPHAPADEQLLEAVDWLEAVVVAAQTQGATVEALAEAHERVHGVAGHLVAMLSDGAKRTKAKRVPKAPAKKRKGAPARGKLPPRFLPHRAGRARSSGSCDPAASAAAAVEPNLDTLVDEQEVSPDPGGLSTSTAISNPYLA